MTMAHKKDALTTQFLQPGMKRAEIAYKGACQRTFASRWYAALT
jgi:hypothetical protein